MDDELIQQAIRMASRAGMPLDAPPSMSKPKTDADVQNRLSEAEERKEWERQRSTHLYENDANKRGVKKGVTIQTGRSALSNRMANNSKPDLFMPQVEKGLDPKQFADGKKDLQDELEKEIKSSGKGGASSSAPSPPSPPNSVGNASLKEIEEAAAKTSEIVAKAGAGNAFQGENLGIGGLDEVLSQVKRRIWVPLAGEFVS